MAVSSKTLSTVEEEVLAIISQRSRTLGGKLGVSRYEGKLGTLGV